VETDIRKLALLSHVDILSLIPLAVDQSRAAEGRSEVAGPVLLESLSICFVPEFASCKIAVLTSWCVVHAVVNASIFPTANGFHSSITRVSALEASHRERSPP
jgi:hypothetical protein